jgi:hypothetical protein
VRINGGRFSDRHRQADRALTRVTVQPAQAAVYDSVVTKGSSPTRLTHGGAAYVGRPNPLRTVVYGVSRLQRRIRQPSRLWRTSTASYPQSVLPGPATLQDRVNVLVPCGAISIFQVGACIEQLFNDLRMIASRFVDGPTRSPFRELCHHPCFAFRAEPSRG